MNMLRQVHLMKIPKPVNFVKQRLLLARLIQTEDVVRHGALRKLRHIILQDVDQCGLGKCLKEHAGNFSEESQLHSTFNSVFINKATSTLVKRANLLWQFQTWCFEHMAYFRYFTQTKLTYVTTWRECAMRDEVQPWVSSFSSL